MKLTKSRVESDTTCPPPSQGYTVYWDSELSGFGLRVTAKGAKSYVVQARVRRKTKRITIGRHGSPATLVDADGRKTTGTLTAERARKHAQHLIGQIAGGIDPVEDQRREEIASRTLRQVVEDYLQNRRRKDGGALADRTKADVRRHLDNSFSDWADKPIANITHDSVRRKYAALGKKSEAQANQAMRVLSGIINYARASYRNGDGAPILPSNPVEVIRDSKIRFADRTRDTRVPTGKIGEFYAALEATRTDPKASISVRTKAAAAVVLMLTGLRKSDVLDRLWSDVDLDAATLHVPDTKHRQPRTFPLASQVVEVLKQHQKISAGPYIFQSDGGAGAVWNLQEGMQPARDAIEHHVATHDLRRTFIDVCSPKRAAIDPLVAELLSNRKGAAYQALKTRMENYDASDMTDYSESAQRIADYFERARLAHEADNVADIAEARA